jgi:predicted flavoprotein YhiN
LANQPAAKTICVIGAGPAGLMAAEVLAEAGLQVAVFDAMPSVGRKFLMAGKGGLNITHAESFPEFISRYGDMRLTLEPILSDFSPEAIRCWAQNLGVTTFIGSSGRVFPVDMKAAPLLRAW